MRVKAINKTLIDRKSEAEIGVEYVVKRIIPKVIQ